MLEYQRERANADVFHIVAQQARIGVRDNQADNQNREHIEQQDSPKHLTHRTWNVLFRIFRFACRDTDQLCSLEGEADDHRHANHSGKTPGKRCITGRPVAPAHWLSAFEDTENHHHANHDEDNYSGNFDQREPVFRFTKSANGNVVQQEDNAEEQCAPDPARRVREPPAHHQLCGHQVNGNRYRPVVPVVPAQREAKAFFYVVLTVSGERAGNRHIGSQFTEAGHQEVHHQTDQDIREQRAARTRRRNSCTRCNEKTCTDGASNGNHRQVTRLQFTT